ncbi:hypothetical protein [Mycoplasma sp. 'Moose RK']|uniref:hypothetical protein n=1 Tax=Mycoplasma sp. 'Moose RK' TaxID=2780095 RepID=UPI0018C2AA0B|nr:hypothetical protein [Mycoplasma sp. 'Moose RK']MBG0730971.1 hypothetical protein [Mycoplasma sp. 'Moose RK']
MKTVKIRKLLLFFPIFSPFFLFTSCFKIDFNFENLNEQKNSKSNQNENEKSFFFNSIMQGLGTNPTKPKVRFSGIFSNFEIENLQLGQNDQKYSGLEEVLVKFFNILNDKNLNFETKKTLFEKLLKKLNSSKFKIDLGVKKDQENINFPKKNLNSKEPVFTNTEDENFYQEQVNLFKSSKNLENFLKVRDKNLFIEEKLIEQKKQWNPLIKIIFQINLTNYQVDLIQFSQELIRDIIVSIINFTTNQEKIISQERELKSKILKLSVQKEKFLESNSKNSSYEVSKTENKLNKTRKNLEELTKINQQIANLNAEFEKLKQSNLEILKSDIKKISNLLVKFFNPSIHVSVNKKNVFFNEVDLKVNNQLAFSKFFEFFSKNLQPNLAKFGISSPFETLGDQKTNFIKKFFLPLISEK